MIEQIAHQSRLIFYKVWVFIES